MWRFRVGIHIDIVLERERALFVFELRVNVKLTVLHWGAFAALANEIQLDGVVDAHALAVNQTRAQWRKLLLHIRVRCRGAAELTFKVRVLVVVVVVHGREDGPHGLVEERLVFALGDMLGKIARKIQCELDSIAVGGAKSAKHRVVVAVWGDVAKLAAFLAVRHVECVRPSLFALFKHERLDLDAGGWCARKSGIQCLQDVIHHK